MTPDQQVRRFAAAHHGLIDRATARRFGLTDRQIRIRTSSGEWRRLSVGVFAVAGAPPVPDQVLLAATWNAGGFAALQSAAWLLGVEERPPRRPEVTTRLDQGRHRAGIHVVRTSDLVRSDTTTVRSIATTNATRTLLDLAATTNPEGLRRSVDRAIRLGLTHPDRLVARFLELARPGRSGVTVARRVLGDLDRDLRLVESDLESMLLRLLRTAGLPPPVLQHPVSIGARRYRIDLCYPQALLAIEADGFAAHGGRSAFEDDRARQNDLVLAGWRVLRFTWRQICREPEWVVDQVRAALVA